MIGLFDLLEVVWLFVLICLICMMFVCCLLMRSVWCRM